jgi:superfamily II DNA helicase RecQ
MSCTTALLKRGIRVAVLTSETATLELWKKIEAGYYQIYGVPEILLDSSKYFWKNILRGPNEFQRRLMHISTDECRVPWAWGLFRNEYKLIGNLRNRLPTYGLADVSTEWISIFGGSKISSEEAKTLRRKLKLFGGS